MYCNALYLVPHRCDKAIFAVVDGGGHGTSFRSIGIIALCMHVRLEAHHCLHNLFSCLKSRCSGEFKLDPGYTLRTWILDWWTWISHHVPQMVHAQLEWVDPQLIFLVMGLNQLHVLLPDGPTDGLLTLQQTQTNTGSMRAGPCFSVV